jgi:hypothetical protein
MSTALNDPATSETVIAANGQSAKVWKVTDYAGSELFSVAADGTVTATVNPAHCLTVAFLIYKSGTTTYAKNATTGAIAYSGTDTSTVINAALTALTADRTWKETIVVRGDFELSAAINPPSYSRIIVDGRLVAADSAQINLVTFSSVHDAELIGGELDGNQAGTTWKDDMTIFTGVALLHSYNCLVDGVYVHDVWGDGFMVRYVESVDNVIQNCIAKNIGSAGFEPLTTSSRNSFINCYATTKTFAGGFSVMDGFEIYSNENSFTNCYAVNCASHGFLFRGTASKNVLTNCVATGCAGNGFTWAETPSYNILNNCVSRGNNYGYLWDAGGTYTGDTVQGCHAIGNTVNGFNVAGTFQFNTLSSCFATGNVIGFNVAAIDHYNRFLDCRAYLNNGRGWQVYSSKYLQFQGCDAINNSQTTDGASEGWEITTVTDSQFLGCRAISNIAKAQDYGFSNEGTCSANSWLGCVAVGNKNGQFRMAGTGHKYRDNIGFVSENAGTSTGTGSQQTIAHGLGAAPTKVILSEYTTGGALAYQSQAADATNIYITATNEKTYAWRAEI